MKSRQYLLSEVHNLWDPFNAETSLFDFREKHSKQLKFDFCVYDKHFGIQYLSINFLESPRT